MSSSRFLTAVVSLLVLFTMAACAPKPPCNTVTSSAFSQPLELTVCGQPNTDANTAAAAAIEDLLFIAEVSHPWNPGPLGRTNQLLGFETEFSANPSILPMIRQATALSHRTQGYYAPALGKLQQLWGFHSELPAGPPPVQGEIDKLIQANPRMSDIRIDGIRMRSNNAAVRVDFGPFAQGYAVDTAIQRLRESGIARARLINGRITAVLGREWKVSIENTPLQGLVLRDGEAAATLSTEDHSYPQGDMNYHNYLNPFTGHPGRGLKSITVIHGSAATAAALAQALLAGGETKLAELLQVIEVEYALAITSDGRTIATEAMTKRLGAVREP